MNSSQIGCVILAAGAGSRFGEPKAGAKLPSGARFVDAVARAAHNAGISHIVAVIHPEVDPPPGIRHVVNNQPASEQIVSLRLGLAQLVNTPVRGALVWPVDYPYVRDETVVTILDNVQNDAPLIARPTFENRHGHPVYFARDVWRDLVTEQQGGARAVVHRFTADVTDIPVDDPGVLRDVDTRADMS